MPQRRLDQLLASLGYGSRRDVRGIVEEGRVCVNGAVAGKFDVRVDAAAVTVDGEPLDSPDGLLVMFHKPLGCVCTHSEEEGPIIYEYLPPRWLARNPVVSSVGRLDKETSGVLIITDQGSLIHKFTSPKSALKKVYEVTTDIPIPAEVESVFAEGQLVLRGEKKPCLPAQLEVTGDCQATLTLTEGRYHQVRRMFASQGLTVTALHRSRFGPYELGDLAPGEWRTVAP